MIAEIAAVYDKNISLHGFYLPFAQLKRNRVNTEWNSEPFESHFPLLLHRILRSYFVPASVWGTLHSFFFLRSVALLAPVFTFSHPSLPCPLSTRSGRLSLLSQGGICYQAIVFIDRETIALHFEDGSWCCLNQYLYFQILGSVRETHYKLVKRRIAEHHLDILNHYIFNYHPSALHLKKPCFLLGRLFLCEQNVEISEEAWWR